MTKPMISCIRVRDHLTSSWSHWFEGLTINHEPNGQTRITAPLRDQAALFAVLMNVGDLGVILISLNRREPGPSRFGPADPEGREDPG
jgi:hypothetical protein